MNPLYFGYANDAHLRAEQYAGTTAAFVLGRSNCLADEWLRVRDRGSEIYKYVIPIERPNSPVSPTDEQCFMGDSLSVPLWPGPRSENTYSKLTDIRVGSPWVTWFVDFIASQIRLKRYSGFFLDGFGSQLFSSADWNNWPLGERQEWTAGAVDLARRLDEMRRAEDPTAIFVCNNYWDAAPQAEQYIDGVVSENHLATGPAWQRIVGKPTYSPLGQRRVFAISRTRADAIAWGSVPGVTHVCCTEDNAAAGNSQYSYPTKPVVGYTNLRDNSALLSAAQQRCVELQQTLDHMGNTLLETEAALTSANATISRQSIECESLSARVQLQAGRLATIAELAKA